MKNVKLYKKTAIIIVGALVATSIVVLSLFIAIHASREASKLEEANRRFDAQKQNIEKLSSDVKSVQYGSGNLLNICINDATTRYSNYIRTNGKVTNNPDSTVSYSLPQEEWAFASGKLDEDRADCQRKYGQ